MISSRAASTESWHIKETQTVLPAGGQRPLCFMMNFTLRENMICGMRTLLVWDVATVTKGGRVFVKG